MAATVALAGWVLALAAAGAALGARLALRRRVAVVSRAAHELRGPLTASRLGIELGLRIRGLSPAQLRAIELELGRAELALDDLGEPSRRGAGPGLAPVAIDRVDIRGLVVDSTEAWRAAAMARNVTLRLAWSGGAAVVLGDRRRLAQATGNLIANAIEHAGAAIEVRGRVERSAVRIEVLDDGPGLSAPLNELARRARRRSRRGGPHGHGLAVAGKVALAHGGRLMAGPSQRGARLVLELPVADELLSVPAG